MRTQILILASLCVACAGADEQNATADSAKAANAIKLHFAQMRTAARAAEKAERDSALRAAQAGVDSQRAAMGIPSDAEFSAMVRRIPPDSLDSIPGPVRTVLKQRHCLIPQPFGSSSPRNFITGAFTAKGAVEWAILCSVDDASQILIITAQTGVLVDSLGKSGDAGWVQGIGDGKSGFSRLITTVSNAAIRGRRTDDDGKLIPQPIDHDGIDEAFLEKASVSYYRAGGSWYRVITSD